MERLDFTRWDSFPDAGLLPCTPVYICGWAQVQLLPRFVRGQVGKDKVIALVLDVIICFQGADGGMTTRVSRHRLTVSPVSYTHLTLPTIA